MVAALPFNQPDRAMTDQPAPQADQPAPLYHSPDWQQIALLLLWRLLPATERTITIVPQDMGDLMAAYPEGPVILFRPTADATTVGLATLAEAEAFAKSYDLQLAIQEAQNAPSTDALQ